AAERRWAGGKGVNVARWLKFLGGRPRLLLPLGGGTGRELTRHLRADKLAATVVPIREPTRVNVIVSTEAQGQMRFNPPGPELRRREWGGVVDRVRMELRRTELLVLSGSLPRGVPVGAYAELLRLAHAASVRALLDCEGPALAAAVAQHPWLVKPNEDELAQWHGGRLGPRQAVLRAAKRLSRKTGGWVLVSRGARGALLVNQSHDYAWSRPAPRLAARNTVGAGDAMLAAVARGLVLNLPPPDWLRFAIATGSAATLCAPGTLPVK
ncbi:MAG TPA: hexose kinase, partial [Methylomirabilota bacterium]|nr:hexose kinase [Methylomirabilota bacterium]